MFNKKLKICFEKYKDIVLWGCLHNLSYDTQCEGVRAEYVYHLTTFFCDETYFVVPIIKAFTSLANEKDDLLPVNADTCILHLLTVLKDFEIKTPEDYQLLIMSLQFLDLWSKRRCCNQKEKK